jgi:hypothetical protein
MEEFSEDRVAAAAERAALINALQHEAEAAVGPIMGPLMAEHPSFRAHADAVSRIVADAVAAVNAESMTWRRERLAAIDADALAAIDAPEPTQRHTRCRRCRRSRAPCACGRRRTRTVRGTSGMRGCPR